MCRQTCVLTLMLTLALQHVQVVRSTGNWINEFHYDNGGADVDEFVEVVLDAGEDPADWTIELYNAGAGGAVYRTDALNTGTVTLSPDGGSNFVVVATTGIQNGPDGIGLLKQGTRVECIAYEGSLTSMLGDCPDIGVGESSATPVGTSLQRTDFGVHSEAQQRSWSSAAASEGQWNNAVGQATPSPPISSTSTTSTSTSTATTATATTNTATSTSSSSTSTTSISASATTTTTTATATATATTATATATDTAAVTSTSSAPTPTTSTSASEPRTVQLGGEFTAEVDNCSDIVAHPSSYGTFQKAVAESASVPLAWVTINMTCSETANTNSRRLAMYVPTTLHVEYTIIIPAPQVSIVSNSSTDQSIAEDVAASTGSALMTLSGWQEAIETAKSSLGYTSLEITVVSIEAVTVEVGQAMIVVHKQTTTGGVPMDESNISHEGIIVLIGALVLVAGCLFGGLGWCYVFYMKGKSSGQAEVAGERVQDPDDGVHATANPEQKSETDGGAKTDDSDFKV